MATEAFTVRTESDIVHQLDSMAGALDRSRNYLVNQALREYLKTHARQIEKITQGIAAADRGEVIAHKDVIKEMEAIAQPASDDDFFDCVGIWEDRDIDQASIRSKAWPDRRG
ncbi:MAG: ribbon-helix-helix protein, CopG family [Methylomonas sp.]|jgi:predicted transcriptional regulator|uniref:CopG family ribbon-helix-helix protein n=1 Tax=Methylomonas sp. TaxID=418 RepID=UPI0025EE4E68|nr:ribbon-helix-helix protein, CopG family [Methylomonas sp.]MCK9608000.1 ribbon-helix-helix protein, CopG family [Methylomonas sp.]